MTSHHSVLFLQGPLHFAKNTIKGGKNHNIKKKKEKTLLFFLSEYDNL